MEFLNGLFIGNLMMLIIGLACIAWTANKRSPGSARRTIGEFIQAFGEGIAKTSKNEPEI